MSTPRMIPGQEPYTPEEWKAVQRLIRGAADEDPGECMEELYYAR